MIFRVGDVWVPETTITDGITNAKVDPSGGVTVTTTSPAGVVSGPTVMIRAGRGEYQASVALTERGKWHVVVKCSGGYQGAQPESITVYED